MLWLSWSNLVPLPGLGIATALTMHDAARDGTLLKQAGYLKDPSRAQACQPLAAMVHSCGGLASTLVSWAHQTTTT